MLPCSGWFKSLQSKGVTLTTEEVRGFLREMDDTDEFDDIALDAVALTAIAGGNRAQLC